MMKKISQEQQVTEEYGTEIVQGVRLTFFIITPKLTSMLIANALGLKFPLVVS